MSQQIAARQSSLSKYGERAQTRTEHTKEVENHLGFRKPDKSDLNSLEQWLVERALEHDNPSLLFSMACQRLYADKFTRPGVTGLERIVISKAFSLKSEKNF